MKKILMTMTALAMTSVVAISVANAAETAKGFSAAQKKEIGSIIKDYLIKNPEVIKESIEALQQKQMQDMQKKAKESLTKNKDALFNNANAPFAGKADGDVAVVEFFDYQCGYCKKVSGDVAKLLANDSNVKVIYREMPILSEMSMVASKAALAANKQGKYVAFHNALIDEKEHLTADKIFEVAKNVGLDVEKLKQDMEAKDVQEEISLSQKLFMELGLRGTPAFVIGSEVIPGAIDYDGMKELVAKARSAKN